MDSRPDDGTEVIETHRGLIHRYARKRTKPGVEEEDLFQEGAIAILEAHGAHDPEKGAFSTIADFYLKNAMNAAEARGSISTPATLPRSTLGRVRRIRRAISRLHSAGHRYPSTREVAAEARLTESRVGKLLPLLESSLREGTYLSSPVGEDGEGELADVLPAEAEDPAESAARAEERGRLLAAVEGLPDGEREVIEAYYGLGDREGADLGVLCRRMGVSRQALHQRLRRARERLRGALADPHASQAPA